MINKTSYCEKRNFADLLNGIGGFFKHIIFKFVIEPVGRGPAVPAVVRENTENTLQVHTQR